VEVALCGGGEGASPLPAAGAGGGEAGVELVLDCASVLCRDPVWAVRQAVVLQLEHIQAWAAE